MEKSHITYEEHLELICELCKLQLHHLWNWLKKHPEEKFSEGLRNRVDLCRKTDPNPKHADIAERNFDTEIWKNLETELNFVYDESKIDGSADLFEFAAFEHVQPILAKFAEKTFGSTFKFDEYQCGSLKYDPPSKEEPKVMMFHIVNAVAPKSIFSDEGYLENCFFDLMKQTEDKFSADTIKTDTWLNSLPKWLEYFPKNWQSNLGPEHKDVQWHFGFWGQFISAKGTFNPKYAEMLRDTGEFPFYPRASHCSFAALKKHLEANLNK